MRIDSIRNGNSPTRDLRDLDDLIGEPFQNRTCGRSPSVRASAQTINGRRVSSTSFSPCHLFRSQTRLCSHIMVVLPG